MTIRPASISTNPTVISLRVAAYWIEASTLRREAVAAAWDLRVAKRALLEALRHANRARDNAAKAVAMRYLNTVRARIASLA